MSVTTPARVHVGLVLDEQLVLLHGHALTADGGKVRRRRCFE
jgi:hypothetical protein